MHLLNFLLLLIFSSTARTALFAWGDGRADCLSGLLHLAPPRSVDSIEWFVNTVRLCGGFSVIAMGIRQSNLNEVSQNGPLGLKAICSRFNARLRRPTGQKLAIVLIA
jgi:hypothetical protein